MSSVSFEHEMLDLDPDALFEQEIDPSFENGQNSTNHKNNSTKLGYYGAALLAAAYIVASPYVKNPDEVQADEPISAVTPYPIGGLEVLDSPIKPGWTVPILNEAYQSFSEEGQSYYSGEVDAGFINYSLTVPDNFTKEGIDNQFIEDVEATLSILNSTFTTTTLKSIANSELNISYSIVERSQMGANGLFIYKSKASKEDTPSYQGVRRFSIPIEAIDAYHPNNRSVLGNIIEAYLSFSFHLSRYQDASTDEQGAIWHDINLFVLAGVSYSEYRNSYGANEPTFSFEDYNDLQRIFDKYGKDF